MLLLIIPIAIVWGTWMNRITFGVESPRKDLEFLSKGEKWDSWKTDILVCKDGEGMFLVLLWWFPSYCPLWYLLRTQTASLPWTQRFLGFPIAKMFVKATPRTGDKETWERQLVSGSLGPICKKIKTSSHLDPFNTVSLDFYALCILKDI